MNAQPFDSNVVRCAYCNRTPKSLVLCGGELVCEDTESCIDAEAEEQRDKDIDDELPIIDAEFVVVDVNPRTAFPGIQIDGMSIEAFVAEQVREAC